MLQSKLRGGSTNPNAYNHFNDSCRETQVAYLRVLCKPLVGARNKYKYERCVASASTHCVEYEYESTRT